MKKFNFLNIHNTNVKIEVEAFDFATAIYVLKEVVKTAEDFTSVEFPWTVIK